MHGHTGAVIWIIASLSVIAMALWLPAAQIHRGPVVAMGIGGCLWGAVSGLFLDYRHRPVWLIHLSTASGVIAIAVAIELSGGGDSPAWVALFYVVVFAAYFFKPPAAAAYFIACVIADAVALVGGGLTGAAGAATLAIAAPASSWSAGPSSSASASCGGCGARPSGWPPCRARCPRSPPQARADAQRRRVR